MKTGEAIKIQAAFQLTKDDGIKVNSSYNVLLALKTDWNINGSLKYNEFTEDCEITKQLKMGDTTFEPGELPSNFESVLTIYLEQELGVSFTGVAIKNGLEAFFTQKKYNPVKDFMEKCKEGWDGKERINSLFQQYLGAEDTELIQKIALLFFVAAVKKVYEPDFKFDYVLDLVGGQGIEGGINRFDTLNNSALVFKNMGVDADVARKSMDKLKDSVEGLPTALDSAVANTQLLTASMDGDMSKSVDVYRAMNDAILGFGGSAAQVDNAVVQLSQSFSNGKVDAQTWNSMINSGMGPVLNALAKQMGVTTGELKSGLSEGKISVDEFQKSLIELDKNGGGGIASLQQIVKDGTKGIRTNIDNTKNALNKMGVKFLEAIVEIFNNINDHSQEKIGCIFGQYYPSKNEIIIAVSDFGIGIPQSIKNKRTNDDFSHKLDKFAERKNIPLADVMANDHYLIEFALAEGVSTQSLPQNRGAGLANIKKAITTNQVGEFTIVSNCGILSVRDNEIVSSTTLEESYPGTFFEIKIDTSNDYLYDQDIEEEFEW